MPTTDTPLASMTNSLISTGPVAEEQKMLEQQEREERKRKVLSIMSRVKTVNPLDSSPTTTIDEKPTHKFTRVDSLPNESILRSPMTTSFIAMSPTASFNAETRRHSEAVPVTTPTTQFKSALLQNLLANRRLSAGAHLLPSTTLPQAPSVVTPISPSTVQEESKTDNDKPLIGEDENQFCSPIIDDTKSSQNTETPENVSSCQTVVSESPQNDHITDSSASPLKTLPNISEECPEDMLVVEVAG
jgi:hypothetical protein